MWLKCISQKNDLVSQNSNGSWRKINADYFQSTKWKRISSFFPDILSRNTEWNIWHLFPICWKVQYSFHISHSRLQTQCRNVRFWNGEMVPLNCTIVECLYSIRNADRMKWYLHIYIIPSLPSCPNVLVLHSTKPTKLWQCNLLCNLHFCCTVTAVTSICKNKKK